MTELTLKLNPELFEKVNYWAESKGISVNEAIAVLIERLCTQSVSAMAASNHNRTYGRADSRTRQLSPVARRPQGYGAQMMQLALARCFTNPRVTAVVLDPLASNIRAHRFYERLGFQFVEEHSRSI